MFLLQTAKQKPTHFPVYCNRTYLTVPMQLYLWLVNTAKEELNTFQLLFPSPCKQYHTYVMSKCSRTCPARRRTQHKERPS